MANNDDLRRYLSLLSEDLLAQRRMIERAVNTINHRLHVGSPGYYSDSEPEESVYEFDGNISDDFGVKQYRWRVAGKNALSYEHIFDVFWSPEKPFIIWWKTGSLITKKPFDLYKLSSNPKQLSGYKDISLPVETRVEYYSEGRTRLTNIGDLLKELITNGDL